MTKTDRCPRWCWCSPIFYCLASAACAMIPYCIILGTFKQITPANNRTRDCHNDSQSKSCFNKILWRSVQNKEQRAIPPMIFWNPEWSFEIECNDTCVTIKQWIADIPVIAQYFYLCIYVLNEKKPVLYVWETTYVLQTTVITTCVLLRQPIRYWICDVLSSLHT